MLDKSILANLDQIKKSCLVYDIESSSHYPDGREINISSDFDNYVKFAKVKWVGLYSYLHDKEYYYTAKEFSKELIYLFNEHSTLIGFNSESFDFPILVNNGLIDPEKKYLHIDCMTILGTANFKNRDGYANKNRAALMDVKLKSNSLESMAKAFGLEYQKGTIDYSIFHKWQWSVEEEKEIIKYLRIDVMAPKALFEKLWAYWLPFAELLDIKDIYNLSWIRSSIAALTYRAACHALNIEPTYADKGEEDTSENMGGNVYLPKYEEARGVWYVDVGSLYPHMAVMANLTSESDDESLAKQTKETYLISNGYYDKINVEETPSHDIKSELLILSDKADELYNETLQTSLIEKKKKGKKVWHGNDVFQVKGYYDVTEWHPLAKYIADKLKERITLKETDPKNPFIYTLKIFLNGLYGVMRSPIFEKVHTPNCGWDICLLGQQVQALMKEMLEQFGFEIIQGDTDSCFFVANEGTDNSREYVQDCLNQIIDIIKDNLPFPVDTFKINIEHYLEYLMVPFSEEPIVGEDGKNVKVKNHLVLQRIGKKKNYLYIYKNKEGVPEVKIVGLPIIKDNATALAPKIYEEVLKPEILKNMRAKFSKSFIEEKVNEYLKRPEAMELVSQEYKVKEANSYKNENQIQAQISRGYFNGKEGIIRLIKNTAIGKAGKGMFYCSIQEAVENSLTVKDLDLDKVEQELSPFVLYEPPVDAPKSTINGPTVNDNTEVVVADSPDERTQDEKDYMDKQEPKKRGRPKKPLTTPS